MKMQILLTGDEMEKNKSIGCTVDDCKHYDSKHCTLDKIQVAHCCDTVESVGKGTKEATMCDSYDRHNKKKAM
jgi:hypothetical protein